MNNAPVATQPNYAPLGSLTPAPGTPAQATPQTSIAAVLSLITSLMSPMDSLLGGWQGIGGANLGLAASYGGASTAYAAAGGYGAPTAYAAAGGYGASAAADAQAAAALSGVASLGAPVAGAQSFDLSAAFALSGYQPMAQSYGSLAGAFALNDSPLSMYSAAGSSAPTAFAAAAGYGGGASAYASPLGAYAGAGSASSNYLLLSLLGSLLGMAGPSPLSTPAPQAEHCKC